MSFFRNFLVVTLFLTLTYCAYRTYLQIRVASLVAAENDQNLELPRHDVDQHWTGLGGLADVQPSLLCPPPPYKA